MKQKNAIKIRNIDDFTFINKKNFIFIFRMLNTSTNEKSIIVNFIRHAYVVNNLKIKLFINNNILNLKKMFVDLKNQKIIIENYKHITMLLKIINKNSSIKRVIKINNITKILINFVTIIFFKLRDKFNLLNKRDFIFVSQRVEQLNIKNNIMSHIVDVYIVIVQTRNVNSKNVFLFKNIKLKIV